MQNSPESEVIVVCWDLERGTWSAASPSNYVSKCWLVAHSSKLNLWIVTPGGQLDGCLLSSLTLPESVSLILEILSVISSQGAPKLSSFMEQKVHDVSYKVLLSTPGHWLETEVPKLKKKKREKKVANSLSCNQSCFCHRKTLVRVI